MMDFVDIEEVLTGWLDSQLSPIGVEVVSRVPDDYNGSQKIVRVVRLGGSADAYTAFDYPRIDVDVFGPDKGTAADLMKVVRRLMLSGILTADLSAWSASVSHVREDVGPQWLDEPDYPPAGRYLIQFTVLARSV